MTATALRRENGQVEEDATWRSMDSRDVGVGDFMELDSLEIVMNTVQSFKYLRARSNLLESQI